MKENEEKKQSVVSDKAEKDTAHKLIKAKQVISDTITVGEDNRGYSIEECPFIPLGSQIVLEWNFTTLGKGGIIRTEPVMKFPHPKVIGYGGNVKSVNIGDRVYIKTNSIGTVEPYEETITGFKFHVIHESAVLGIYTGKVTEDPFANDKKDSKIIQ